MISFLKVIKTENNLGVLIYLILISNILSRRDKGTKGQSICIRKGLGGSEFVFCKHFTKRNVNILTLLGGEEGFVPSSLTHLE